MDHIAINIEFQMSLLLFVSLDGYLLASRIGQPAVVGIILVGLVVGPSVLSWITYTDFIRSIAHLGAAVLLFVVGLEFKLKDLVNPRYLWIGAAGVVVPFVGGYWVCRLFDLSVQASLFIGVAITALMNCLQNYQWTGNVRELENVLDRAVINSSGPKLHLVDELKKPYKDLTPAQKTLDESERDYIVRVLEQNHWKVSGKDGAADILGLDRSTLRARMRKLGIV